MPEPELKPCPFCENTSVMWNSADAIDLSYTVACFDCDCEGPLGDSPDEAVELWNKAPRRSELDELRSELSLATAYAEGRLCD